VGSPRREGGKPNTAPVHHVSGEDLGVHRFAVPDRNPGDLIPLGHVGLRVVRVEWLVGDEPDGVTAVLVVKSP
jgi:hypothetical protein